MYRLFSIRESGASFGFIETSLHADKHDGKQRAKAKHCGRDKNKPQPLREDVFHNLRHLRQILERIRDEGNNRIDY